MEEQQILIHRINMCGRIIKHFQLGSVNLLLGPKGVLSGIEIVKGCHTVAKFKTIDEMEDYAEKLMLAEEDSRIKDPILRARIANIHVRSTAKFFNLNYYDVPSKINNVCRDVTIRGQSAEFRPSSQKKTSEKQIAV